MDGGGASAFCLEPLPRRSALPRVRIQVSHNYLAKIIQGDGKRKINRIFSINICPKHRNKKVTALRRGFPEHGFFKKSSNAQV